MRADVGTTIHRIWQRLFPLLCYLVLVFLLAPLLIVIPLSFTAEQYFSFTPGMLALDPAAYSLRWYREVLTTPAWRNALATSLQIALASSLITTTVGTLAAWTLWRRRLPLEAAIMALVVAPTVMPVVVTAVGIYVAFDRVRLTQTLIGVILVHATLSLPYCVVTLRAALSGFDRNLARAAASLGASPWLSFRSVMLPIIAPSMASAAIVAFLGSFEELVVVLFLLTGELQTIPKMLWAGAREQLSPAILAAAVLLAVSSMVLLGLAQLLAWYRRRASSRQGAAGSA